MTFIRFFYHPCFSSKIIEFMQIKNVRIDVSVVKTSLEKSEKAVLFFKSYGTLCEAFATNYFSSLLCKNLTNQRATGPFFG